MQLKYTRFSPPVFSGNQPMPTCKVETVGGEVGGEKDKGVIEFTGLEELEMNAMRGIDRGGELQHSVKAIGMAESAIQHHAGP